MDETIFHIIELAITVIAAVTARHLIPWLKAKLSADQITTLRTIAEVAVLAAQQLHGNEPGGDRTVCYCLHPRLLLRSWDQHQRSAAGCVDRSSRENYEDRNC